MTAIDEGLAKLLTILCHAHATQSKLAVDIKRKGMHMTSVRQDANVGCAIVWQHDMGLCEFDVEATWVMMPRQDLCSAKTLQCGLDCTCAFKTGCLMSHNWLHTPDCKV